jgi:hypothetical protein
MATYINKNHIQILKEYFEGRKDLDFMLILTDLDDDFADFIIGDYKGRNGIVWKDKGAI